MADSDDWHVQLGAHTHAACDGRSDSYERRWRGQGGFQALVISATISFDRASGGFE